MLSTCPVENCNHPLKYVLTYKILIGDMKNQNVVVYSCIMHGIFELFEDGTWKKFEPKIEQKNEDQTEDQILT